MRPVAAAGQGARPLWNPGSKDMDTTIKFRTSTHQKRALERAAEQFGWSMSELIRRGANMAQRGLITSDAALNDFRQMREYANAAIAALDAGADREGVAQAREAMANVHRLANQNLRQAL